MCSVPVAWKECCAEYWLGELHESRDRYTGCQYITEIFLKIDLTLSQASPGFFVSAVEVYWEHIGKRRNFP